MPCEATSTSSGAALLTSSGRLKSVSAVPSHAGMTVTLSATDIHRPHWAPSIGMGARRIVSFSVCRRQDVGRRSIESPGHPFRLERQQNRGVELFRCKPLDENSAKAACLRRLNRRSTALAPAHAKARYLVGRFDLPLHDDPAVGPRKRTILRCVGCQLVERKADRLGRVGRDDDRWPLYLDAARIS
jgi:hypothetical protein